MTSINDEVSRIFPDKKLLIITNFGYPCYGGGEEFMMDIGVLCSTKLQIKTQWIFFQQFLDNKISNISKNFQLKINDNFELCGFDGGWSLPIIEKHIKGMNPNWIIHQGDKRLPVISLSHKLKIPCLSGICFWNGVIESPNSSNKFPFNYQILKNIPIYKTHPTYRSFTQNIFSVSPFITLAVNRITKKTPPLSIYSLSLSQKLKPLHISTDKTKYITIINLNQWKGAKVALQYLIESTPDSPPLLCIDSERTNIKDKLNQNIYSIIELKNKEREIPHIIYGRQENLSHIYGRTRILLIPSLVDETFCRVAYEGLYYEIPMISSKNGNIPYLLGQASIYCDDEPNKWVYEINQLYKDEEKITELKKECQRRKLWINDNLLQEQLVEALLYYNPIYQHVKIGIYCPWADQGLGVQARNYAYFFKRNGFQVFILGFKSYFDSSPSNGRVVSGEWGGFQVFEYPRNRDQVTIQDVNDFINKTNITHFIIPETCWSNVFKIAKHTRSLNIKTIAIPNMEIVRSNELISHQYFHEIWNNYDSGEKLWQQFIDEGRVGENPPILRNFGYYHENPSMYYIRKSWQKDMWKPINFFCIGGLNSITRKSIQQITKDFIEFQNKYKISSQLYIYIQGKQIPNLPKHPSITLTVKSMPYFEILQLYHRHDIHIHMGTHEGLGLGFYEAIQQGCPVLTMDCNPNNEIIRNNKNGWTIPCTPHKMTDNSDGVVMEHHYNSEDFIDKLNELVNLSGKEWNIWMNQMELYMYHWMKHKKQDWVDKIKSYFL